MKTIYIDKDFMCHASNDGTMIEVQTDMFDNYCDAAIEFFRYIPQGSSWVDPKGRTINGLFVQSTNMEKIDQKQIEAALVDMTNALAILGVTE